MTDSRDLPEQAHGLINTLEQLDGNETGLLSAFAAQLREVLPLPAEARGPLARTLFVATSLAEAWVEDTAELLERGAAFIVDDEVSGLITDRLTILRWAWTDPPESWPPERSEDRADWRADLDRALTSSGGRAVERSSGRAVERSSGRAVGRGRAVERLSPAGAAVGVVTRNVGYSSDACRRTVRFAWQAAAHGSGGGGRASGPARRRRVPASNSQVQVGLWDGGALLSYDQAEHQGFIDDPRMQHPPPGSYETQVEANQRRYERWERDARLGRGEIYLEIAQLDLEDVDSVLEFVSTFGVLDVRALDAPRMARQWYGVALERRVPFRILRHYPGFGDGSRRAALDQTWRDNAVATAEAQRAAAPNWVVAETVEEFRWGARANWDLYNAWLCLRGALDPQTVEWANSRMPGAGCRSRQSHVGCHGVLRADDARGARGLLTTDVARRYHDRPAEPQRCQDTDTQRRHPVRDPHARALPAHRRRRVLQALRERDLRAHFLSARTVVPPTASLE